MLFVLVELLYISARYHKAWLTKTWAPSQYPKRRLIVRSREVSKPRDWYFELSYRFEIWQAHRQQCCRSACQISERSKNSKYKSRGFETSRDLTIRRLFGYWDGALVTLLCVNEYYNHDWKFDYLLAGRHQAIDWSNIGLFWNGPWSTNVNEISINR